MRPGLPAWRKLASQKKKYAYRYQNMTSHHGLTKRVAAPIATSEFEIRYGRKSLQNGLINCLNVSIRLIVFEQYFVYHSIGPNCLQFFAKQSGILCSVYASSCDVQKERYA